MKIDPVVRRYLVVFILALVILSVGLVLLLINIFSTANVSKSAHLVTLLGMIFMVWSAALKKHAAVVVTWHEEPGGRVNEL